MAKANLSKLETGIELLIGRPGSGKSLFCVQRLIRVMEEQRRPCYTNLPLKMRVFRKYLQLKGGEELAGLIRPLTEAHFRAFTQRFTALHKWRTEARLLHPNWGRQRLAAEWEKIAGPNVTQGPEANWIPATAIVVLDECQHWYPNPANKNVPRSYQEPAELQGYLTMHRHLLHWVWVATQREVQISTTIRGLANRVWEICPRDDDRLAWGIRFKHLGIKCLGYKAYSPEQKLTDEPQEVFSCFPSMPWNQIYFRLYESFTHGGSPRELKAGLRAARLEAGLRDDGKMDMEVVEVSSEKKRGCLVRAMVGTVKLAGIFVVLLVAVAFGSRLGDKGGETADAGAEGGGSQVVEADDAEWKGVDREAFRAARIDGMMRDGVRVNGNRVSVGGTWNGFVLIALEPARGVAVWQRRLDGDVWLSNAGEGFTRLGPIEAVARAFEVGEPGGQSGIGAGAREALGAGRLRE